MFNELTLLTWRHSRKHRASYTDLKSEVKSLQTVRATPVFFIVQNDKKTKDFGKVYRIHALNILLGLQHVAHIFATFTIYIFLGSGITVHATAVILPFEWSHESGTCYSVIFTNVVKRRCKETSLPSS